MPITLDDKAEDVFKLYDEMAIAYSKDIEGYKAHIVAIEAMIAQKEEMLRDVRDKTVALVKTSLEIIPSSETPVRKKDKKLESAGVDVVEALFPEKDIEAGERSSGGAVSGGNSTCTSEKDQIRSPKENQWKR